MPPIMSGEPPVSPARHKQAVQHLLRRRVLRVVLPAAAATLVTGTDVGVAVGRGADPATPAAPARVASAPLTATIDPADSPYLASRTGAISRSAKRVTLQRKPPVTGHKWLTAPLNLWATPREHGKPLAVLSAGGQVAVTGVRTDGFAQILHGGLVRWVHAAYLADHKPKPPAPPKPAAPKPTTPTASATGSPSDSSSSSSSSPSASSSSSSDSSDASPSSGGGLVSEAPCPSGSSMESGIVSRAVTLHRTVCAHFPQVKEYGGWRGDGEHSDGHAIDIMVYSDSGTGQAVADWLRANASALHIDNIIWAQHIWTTQRSSEGWRSMPDRGSTTANHYDHVHVRVF